MKDSGPRPLPQPSLKHPGRWIWLFLLVPIVLGLVRLRFDVEVFDLLPSDLEAVQGLKLYQEHFANARELIVTLQAPSAEQAENAARALAEHLRPESNFISTVTWEPPWIEHPDQGAELIAYLWFNQAPGVFGELTNRLTPDKLGPALIAAREELATSMSPQQIALLSYDPFGLTRLPEIAAGAAPSFGEGQESFSSSDGTFRIMFVKAVPELRTYRDCDQWLTAVKQIAGRTLASEPGLAPVTIGYTGRPALVAEVAAGMQHDVTISVGGTAAIIAVLFWLAHRRVKPMLWLLTLLAIILGSTLALGGLIFGTINVVSMGFAAILLGLAVDYAVVHYQEALAHPVLTIPQIRHAIAPSIFWAAVTTIAAFLVLNFGGLPGLGQLGTMVGLGVALAATIMIFEFLPPLFPGRNEPRAAVPPEIAGMPADAAATRMGLEPESAKPIVSPAPVSPNRTKLVFGTTGLILICTGIVLGLRLPPIDTTANALRPRRSPAYAALDAIQAHLNQRREPLWVITAGETVTNVAKGLDQVQAVLSRAVSNQWIAGFTLPTPLWPRPAFQQANGPIARQLAGERELLRMAALTNGFAESSLGLTEKILDTWQVASDTQGIFWPTNPLSQWVFEKLAARTLTNYFALGLINPTTNAKRHPALMAQIDAALPGHNHNVWLSGWELLGHAIFSRVQANMWKVLAPMVVLVLLSLYLAFRRPLEIVLSLAALLLSGLCLLTVMRVAGWSWNLLNLMAIPLVLGTGVDYSIFMQLALRRFYGDLDIAYRSVGRALLLCGGTAVAGFGSLALSSNAGMASLGQVCAVGIGSNMLIAIFLLPIWWRTLKGKDVGAPGRRAQP
jgi:predicted RND superfamily exporter protein